MIPDVKEYFGIIMLDSQEYLCHAYPTNHEQGNEMATWRKQLTNTMAANGESWLDVESTTLTDAEMDKEFYDGFGGSEGCPFTLWTKNRVYFPAVYDGAEWVESVSRNPDGKPTSHVGGE